LRKRYQDIVSAPVYYSPPELYSIGDGLEYKIDRFGYLFEPHQFSQRVYDVLKALWQETLKTHIPPTKKFREWWEVIRRHNPEV